MNQKKKDYNKLKCKKNCNNKWKKRKKKKKKKKRENWWKKNKMNQNLRTVDSRKTTKKEKDQSRKMIQL